MQTLVIRESKHQAPVVPRKDNATATGSIAIQWISVTKKTRYIDSDVSGGWRYLPFEQPGQLNRKLRIFCKARGQKLTQYGTKSNLNR